MRCGDLDEGIGLLCGECFDIEPSKRVLRSCEARCEQCFPRCACGHLVDLHGHSGCYAHGVVDCECRRSYKSLVSPSAVGEARASGSGASHGLPSNPPLAAFFERELAVECEQLDLRVQVAVSDARLELRAAHELSSMAALEHTAPFRTMRAKRDVVTARMVSARVKWLKLAGLMLVLLVAQLCGACGDNLCGEVTVVDAAPAVDAALPTCTFDDVQRSEECKLVCAAQFMRCQPADSGSDCYDECRAFQTGTFYCPPMSTATRGGGL